MDMIHDKAISEFFFCSCGTHGILFTRWPDDDESCLSVWHLGDEGRWPMSWKLRLKTAFEIITKGKVSNSDSIILSKDDAKKLSAKLLEFSGE